MILDLLFGQGAWPCGASAELAESLHVLDVT